MKSEDPVGDVLRAAREIPHDARDCPACGRAWATFREALECCAPIGAARAAFLDLMEGKERMGILASGTTAEVERDLLAGRSDRRNELAAAWDLNRPWPRFEALIREWGAQYRAQNGGA